MLTPEEFVRAGDQLVRLCPTWSWQPGETANIRPYLPSDKQFLVTRGVPSYNRVANMQSSTVTDKTIPGDVEGDDWCAPELIVRPDEDDDEVVVDASMIEEIANSLSEQKLQDSSSILPPPPPADSPLSSSSSNSPPQSSSVEDEYADMEEEGLALDSSALPPSSTSNTHPSTSNPFPSSSSSSSSTSSNVLRLRRYDVSLTYDNYYRTPRVWLFGYDENGSALRPEAIFQDVMQDYAKRTVTLDPHPHLSLPHASIHPCQHATAMLRILSALQEAGVSPLPGSEQYLFIFLKFIQSVVPTIEYDYTIDVQARGK